MTLHYLVACRRWSATRKKFVGGGKQSRDFTFVQNVIEANLCAMTAKNAVGQIFNIACDSKITINELAATIAKLLGKSIQAKHAEARAGEIKHSRADISKAKRVLGWFPSISFEEGLKQTIDWFGE